MKTQTRAPRHQSKVWYNASKQRWIGDYWQAGKRCQVTGKDKATVETALKDRRFEVETAERNGDAPIDNRLTVGVLMDRWLASGCLSTKGKPNAVTVSYNDRMLATNLRPYLGHVAIKDLNGAKVTEAFEALVAKGRGTSTLLRLRSLLGRVLWYASYTGGTIPTRASTAASDAITPQDVTGAREQRALSAAEVASMLTAFEGHRFGPVLTLIAFTGLRPSEAWGLTFGAWSEATSMLTISQAVVQRGGVWQPGPVKTAKHGKQGAAARTIALAPQATAALKAQRASLPYAAMPSAPIFPGPSGWQDIRQFGHEVMVKTGQEVYSLRHTVASRLLDQGWAVPKVAAFLGHTPQTLMRTYAHAMPSDNTAAAVDAVAAVFA